MDLVLTVSVSLAAALVLGYVTQRIGLSPLVGYLLAGILVGPNTLTLAVASTVVMTHRALAECAGDPRRAAGPGRSH